MRFPLLSSFIIKARPFYALSMIFVLSLVACKTKTRVLPVNYENELPPTPSLSFMIQDRIETDSLFPYIKKYAEKGGGIVYIFTVEQAGTSSTQTPFTMIVPGYDIFERPVFSHGETYYQYLERLEQYLLDSTNNMKSINHYWVTEKPLVDTFLKDYYSHNISCYDMNTALNNCLTFLNTLHLKQNIIIGFTGFQHDARCSNNQSITPYDTGSFSFYSVDYKGSLKNQLVPALILDRNKFSDMDTVTAFVFNWQTD